MVPPLGLASGVLALVAPPLERLKWVPTLEGLLGVAVSADKEEVGVLAVRLLCVEAGSLEELTVDWGYLAQPQPQKISVSGVLDLPAGILEGIGESCPSVRRLNFWLRRLRCLRG